MHKCTHHRDRFNEPTFCGGQCPSVIFAFTSSSTEEAMNSSYDSNVLVHVRSVVGHQVVKPGLRFSCGSFEDTSTSSNATLANVYKTA